MIPIFVKERKLAKRKEIQPEKNNMGAIFRNGFTRIEKWRIILFWIFIDRIQVLPGIEDYENFRDEIEEVERWLNGRKNTYITDCGTVQHLLRFKAIHTLREHCLKTITMAYEKGICSAILYEMKGI